MRVLQKGDGMQMWRPSAATDGRASQSSVGTSCCLCNIMSVLREGHVLRREGGPLQRPP